MHQQKVFRECLNSLKMKQQQIKIQSQRFNKMKINWSIVPMFLMRTICTFLITVFVFQSGYHLFNSVRQQQPNQSHTHHQQKEEKQRPPPPPTSCHPADECWKTIDVTQISPQEIVDYFMWTNRSSCRIAQDFGGVMLYPPNPMIDGSKAICLDPPARPPIDGNCVVYSFGINHDWSFDELMQKYGCRVYAFDPSMGVGHHNHSEKIEFFDFGLDDRDYVNPQNNWTMKRFDSLYKLIHGTSSPIIDYLKIDIEFAEWRVLPQLVAMLKNNQIRQLHVEIHLSRGDSLDLLRQRVAVLKQVEDEGAMIRFDSRGNPFYRSIIQSLNKDKDLSLGYDLAWYKIIP